MSAPSGWALAALLGAAALSGGAPALAAGRWDSLGAEFCRLSLGGDLAAMAPILSRQLQADIVAAQGHPDMQPPRTLFQTYSNEVPVCEARTRNVALIEIRRSGPGGGAPSWTEYAVVVPEPDGTSRIDDVLFATRKSDTLRARLDYYAATR